MLVMVLLTAGSYRNYQDNIHWGHNKKILISSGLSSKLFFLTMLLCWQTLISLGNSWKVKKITPLCCSFILETMYNIGYSCIPCSSFSAFLQQTMTLYLQFSPPTKRKHCSQKQQGPASSTIITVNVHCNLILLLLLNQTNSKRRYLQKSPNLSGNRFSRLACVIKTSSHSGSRSTGIVHLP